MAPAPSGNDDACDARERWGVPLICIAAAALLFSPSLNTGTFINHPASAIRLPLVSHVRNVGTLFHRDFTFFTDGQYRPFGYVVLATLRTVVGV